MARRSSWISSSKTKRSLSLLPLPPKRATGSVASATEPVVRLYIYGSCTDYTCEGRNSIKPYNVGVSLVGELTVRELLRLILSPLEKCHVTLSLRRLRGDKSVRSSSAKSVLMRMTALL